MSAWRLDEVPAAVESGLVADLDVLPGDPNTRRQIERLERAVEAQPRAWQNRVALARTFVQDGQFERASQELRIGLDLASDPRVLSAIFFNLGVCEENQERWEQAAGAYEQCVFLMPQLFWGHYGLGVSLHRMGNHAGAMISLRHALALGPDVEETHQALAELYLDAGLLREAETECLWLLDLDPDHIWAARALVDLRGRLN